MLGACANLSSVACPALHYFFTLTHKRHDFRGGGGVIEQLNIKCRFRFPLQLFFWNVRSKRN